MPPISPFSNLPWSLTPHLGDKRSASDTDEEEDEEEYLESPTLMYSSSGGSDSESSQVRLFSFAQLCYEVPLLTDFLLPTGMCPYIETKTASEGFVLRPPCETRENLIDNPRTQTHFRQIITIIIYLSNNMLYCSYYAPTM